MTLPRFSSFRLFLLALALWPWPAFCADYLVYFGTRDLGADKGFSLAHFDSVTGALTQPMLIEPAVGPGFFMIHPDGKHLYTVNTLGPDNPGEGKVSAYAMDAKTGHLTLLNSQPSGGPNPAHLSFDRIAVFPILPDGSLGARTAFDQHTGKSVTPDRKPQPYAHSSFVDPTNRFVLNPDLGLDRIYIYKFDEKTGTLTPNDPAYFTDHPASGPRHLTFSPDGKFVYAVHEIANVVGVYQWDSAKGVLTEVQSVSTIPADYKGPSTAAEIQFHPSGKFLYVSNRGHNSMAVFTVDAATGLLTLIQNISTQGKTPRNFTLDPTAHWLLASNQESNSAIVYSVDQATGRLTQVGPLATLPSAPFCERFVPAITDATVGGL
jgi:6-phosphogluconolactonase